MLSHDLNRECPGADPVGEGATYIGPPFPVEDQPVLQHLRNRRLVPWGTCNTHLQYKYTNS